MREISPPKFSPYGVPDRLLNVVMDGVSYALTAPSNFTLGEMTITSIVSLPLADLIDGRVRPNPILLDIAERLNRDPFDNLKVL